ALPLFARSGNLKNSDKKTTTNCTSWKARVNRIAIASQLGTVFGIPNDKQRIKQKGHIVFLIEA
ncbi:MAG: hypothetical protein ACI8RD_010717, partial [Bacillariaceae sp.]